MSDGADCESVRRMTGVIENEGDLSVWCNRGHLSTLTDDQPLFDSITHLMTGTGMAGGQFAVRGNGQARAAVLHLHFAPNGRRNLFDLICIYETACRFG